MLYVKSETLVPTDNVTAALLMFAKSLTGTVKNWSRTCHSCSIASRIRTLFYFDKSNRIEKKEFGFFSMCDLEDKN